MPRRTGRGRGDVIRRIFALALAVMFVLPACTTGSLVPVAPSSPPTIATPTGSPLPQAQASPSPTAAPTESPIPDVPPLGELTDTSMGAVLILLLDKLVDAESRAARAEAQIQALREQIARMQAQLDALRDEVIRLGGGP